MCQWLCISSPLGSIVLIDLPNATLGGISLIYPTTNRTRSTVDAGTDMSLYAPSCFMVHLPCQYTSSRRTYGPAKVPALASFMRVGGLCDNKCGVQLCSSLIN